MLVTKHSGVVAGLLLASTIGVGLGAAAQEEAEKNPDQMEADFYEQERQDFETARVKQEQAQQRSPEALAARLKQMEEISAKLKVERERRAQAAAAAKAEPQPVDTRSEEDRTIEETEKVLRTSEKTLLSSDDKNPAWFKARTQQGVTTGREALGNARRVKLQKLWGKTLEQADAVTELQQHGRRMAVLRRIAIMAEVKRYPNTVSRAAKLIERENQRHESVMQQLRDKDTSLATKAEVQQ